MIYCANDGFNDVEYTFAHGIENIYFMLYRKYIPFEEYKISTQKDEYVYMHRKDIEMKNDNITVENEGIVENGSVFMNFNIFFYRVSTKLYQSLFLEILPMSSIFQDLFNGM